jgi:hypothetical protein
VTAQQEGGEPVTGQLAAAGKPGKAAAPPADPYGQAAALRGQAAAIEAAAAGPGGYVRVRIGPPHGYITYEGYTIGREFTPVHASKLARLRQGAADAGVTLIEEE